MFWVLNIVIIKVGNNINVIKKLNIVVWNEE